MPEEQWKGQDALAYQLIAKLFEQEVQVDGNINCMTLIDLLTFLSKKTGVTFVIRDEDFTEAMGIKEKKPSVASTKLSGLLLHHFLVQVLDSMGATYMVNGGDLEIVSPSYAAKMTNAELDEDKEGRKSLKDPLVSALIKQKSLADVIEMLGNRYDLNLVIDPQAGGAPMSLVSARLLNVPVDRALEILAGKCEMRVVRNGNVFLITARDRAAGKPESASQEAYENGQIEPPTEVAVGAIPRIERVLTRFHKVVRKLAHRHGRKKPLKIGDEYDVQDLLKALFIIDFDDVRPEEWTPSYAGSSGKRMDILFKKHDIVVEVKKTRDTLRDKGIGEELLIDIAHYKEHPNCQTLVCFVYDPDQLVINPVGLKNDLERQTTSTLKVSVIICQG